MDFDATIFCSDLFCRERFVPKCEGELTHGTADHMGGYTMHTQNRLDKSMSIASDGMNEQDCFHLVLLSESDEMTELWLPENPEGFFRFSDSPEYRFLSIVARDRRWNAVCKKPAFFRGVPLEYSCDIALEDGQLLCVDFDDKIYTIFVEKVSQSNKCFHSYLIRSGVEISIGSQPDNDIICDMPHISGRHAIIKYDSM